MKHISHPGHLLELKEDDVIRENAICYVCDKTVIGTPTYTCTSKSTGCQSFYLHKSCAELPPKINHNQHKQHPLAYLPCEENYCNVCYCNPKFAYSCLEANCDFNVCVSCASEERVFQHEGHEEHTLTLVQRLALFTCDACGEEAKDFSYICNICQFWIHKGCALSPFHISVLTYHHHPLTLIYAIPDMHQYFSRYCAICDKKVHVSMWMYYCHKCTYFVHMKCAASSDTESMLNEVKSDGIHNKADLAQFPLCNEESIFELILSECGKLQVEVQGKGKNSITISTMPSDPHMIEEHWSHKIHPLQLLQFIISENDDIDDRKTLICDGCIQPITASHPHYYACNQCSFFLHSFCATKLPMELPAGASSFHPQHLLLLRKRDIFYELVECGVCCYFTNGFYYQCETCDIKVDIRCAFSPPRINHTSHKHYSLIQRPFSGSRCKLCRRWISEGVEYACETCNKFHIHWYCALYPSQMKHKYDSHPLNLRCPPFFYEGVFYCEVCEKQVNNQLMLYHCGACDHSFHYNCLRSRNSIKLGGTIELTIDNQPHTLTFVIKRSIGKNAPGYYCRSCQECYYYDWFFECDGCGYLLCNDCVTRKLEK